MADFHKELKNLFSDYDKISQMVKFISWKYYNGDEDKAYDLYSKAVDKLLFHKKSELIKINKSADLYFKGVVRNLFIDETRETESKNKHLKISLIGTDNNLDKLSSSEIKENEPTEKEKQKINTEVDFILKNLDQYITDENNRTILLSKRRGIKNKDLLKEFADNEITHNGKDPFTINLLKQRYKRLKDEMADNIRKRHPDFYQLLIDKFLTNE